MFTFHVAHAERKLHGNFLLAPVFHYGLAMTRRDDYLASVRKLRQRHPDIFLGAHPSHNDTLGRRARMGDGSNPFHDPLGWHAYPAGLERSALASFLLD